MEKSGWGRLVTFPESKRYIAPEAMDDWKTIRLPFGVNGLFSGDMLVSGRVYRYIISTTDLSTLGGGGSFAGSISNELPTSFPVS